MKQNANGFRILILAAILGLGSGLAFPTHAKAEENLSKLDEKAEDMSLDAQVDEMEGYAYDDYANQTSIEAKQVGDDIQGLKHKISQLSAEKARAQKRAAAEAKRLSQNAEAQRVAQIKAGALSKESAHAQKDLEKLKQRAEALQARSNQVKERTEKAKDALAQAQKEKSEWVKRQKQAEMDITRESKRKKLLDQKRVRVSMDVYRLKGNVAKLESRSQRLQMDNGHSTAVATKSSGLKKSQRLSKASQDSLTL
jgi:chromosome segregation ATPase